MSCSDRAEGPAHRSAAAGTVDGMRTPVYYYTHLPGSFAVAAEVLGGDPTCWLPSPGEAAEDGGWLALLHADGVLPDPAATLHAIVALEAPSGSTERLSRTMSWRAAAPNPAFPFVTADIDLERLPGGDGWLSLIGTCSHPPSVRGGWDERQHRLVAEACMRRFLLAVAGNLAAAVPPGGGRLRSRSAA
jgi:hypothetical protein